MGREGRLERPTPFAKMATDERRGMSTLRGASRVVLGESLRGPRGGPRLASNPKARALGYMMMRPKGLSPSTIITA